MTFSGGMLQKRDILFRMSSGTSCSERHTMTSGWIPRASSSLAECCVGLDLSSLEPGWPR